MRKPSKAIRYRKPCLAGLPSELGKQIFREILAMKPCDEKRLRTNSRRMLSRFNKRLEQMEQEASGK